MVVEQKRNDEFKFLINEGMTERLKVADCKSVRFSYVGSNPTSFNKQERQDLNPQPMVLETTILPIELLSLIRNF